MRDDSVARRRNGEGGYSRTANEATYMSFPLYGVLSSLLSVNARFYLLFVLSALVFQT
jgi:hypothetical protein